MAEKKKKTAIDVVIDSFIKRVQKDGVMPWQNPHKFGVSINWVSKKMYRGINRMILPSGEYMTKTSSISTMKSTVLTSSFKRVLNGFLWYSTVK